VYCQTVQGKWKVNTKLKFFYWLQVNRPLTENGASQPGSSQVPEVTGGVSKEESIEASVKDDDKVPEDIFAFYEKMDHDDDETELQTVSFEINQEHLELLQKR